MGADIHEAIDIMLELRAARSVLPTNDFERSCKDMGRGGETYESLTQIGAERLTREFLKAQENARDWIVDAAAEVNPALVCGCLKQHDSALLGAVFFLAIVKECRRSIERELEDWADAQRHD